MTREQIQSEYDRCWVWRDLWTRLANRKKKTGSERAIFLSTLQSRNENIQRRAWLKNQQIKNLMLAADNIFKELRFKN